MADGPRMAQVNLIWAKELLSAHYAADGVALIAPGYVGAWPPASKLNVASELNNACP